MRTRIRKDGPKHDFLVHRQLQRMKHRDWESYDQEIGNDVYDRHEKVEAF